MILKALEVENYRNIPAARFEPGRELTVICGKNGQGKTNLLEAVWLLTGGKSFRGAKDAELIRENAGYAVAEGETQGFGKESEGDAVARAYFFAAHGAGLAVHTDEPLLYHGLGFAARFTQARVFQQRVQLDELGMDDDTVSHF